MDFEGLIFLIIVFLAGVGLGTFVIGTLIRKIAAESKAEFEKAKTELIEMGVEARNAIQAARKALP